MKKSPVTDAMPFNYTFENYSGNGKISLLNEQGILMMIASFLLINLKVTKTAIGKLGGDNNSIDCCVLPAECKTGEIWSLKRN